jgi:NTE family protein
MLKRALVLQGGGPLGAYEAGAYRVLYDTISSQIKEEENVFDIVAGTSIGAINAAIIVSHVIQNRRKHPEWSVLKSWQGSADKLEGFWKKRISSEPDLNGNANYRNWVLSRTWYPHLYPKIATDEAARRYYSAQEFLFNGAENVFTPEDQFPLWDNKFLDNYFNLWYRHENYPLKKSIEAYATFPIKTNPTNNEPRLLLVTVDIEEGETVTFDSYSENSEYGKYDEERREHVYIINYDEGLMVEHVMASASVPLLYVFQRVPKNYDYVKAKRGQEQDLSPEGSRPFWDGALLSNTPIRELINHHKLFWEKDTTPLTPDHKTLYEMRTEPDKQKRERYAEQLFEILWNEMTRTTTGEQERLKAPDLDVYIVNLWPTEEKPFPVDGDFDLTKDRMFDIINHDKTKYDLKVAKFVTDYIELTRNLIQQLAKGGDNNKQVARRILLDDSKTKSTFREDIPRKYLDLLIGRFDVNEKLRLERTEDPETTISNKWVDLSIQTVTKLFNQGKGDAQSGIAGM